jgi:membrane protease YdiL (CAAX protease family)
MQSSVIAPPATVASAPIHSAPLTPRRRWTDLAIVLVVATGPSIAASIYVLFHPRRIVDTNPRIGAGFLYELIALTLFGILFTRQRRKLSALGLSFRWTDLPKALGLTVASFAVMWIAYYVVWAVWVTLAQKNPQIPDTSSRFDATSLWFLLPFLLLNPFFEEVLVRGYLMTELIELRHSVAVAVVVSLAVQTSYHLYYGIVGALSVGSGLAVFALYYAKSRRLTPVILAHLLWDLTSLLGAWHR